MLDEDGNFVVSFVQASRRIKRAKVKQSLHRSRCRSDFRTQTRPVPLIENDPFGWKTDARRSHLAVLIVEMSSEFLCFSSAPLCESREHRLPILTASYRRASVKFFSLRRNISAPDSQRRHSNSSGVFSAREVRHGPQYRLALRAKIAYLLGQKLCRLFHRDESPEPRRHKQKIEERKLKSNFDKSRVRKIIPLRSMKTHDL